jgi:glycosyltransferase involved in cell wall biosynthesis
VCVVSHAYVTPVNHDKLRALAALDDIDLTLLIPDAWRTATSVLTLPSIETPYRIARSPITASGRIGAYRYRDLSVVRRGRFDVVHAEVEPWSLAAWQITRAAGSAPVVLFSWENLEGPRRLASRTVERLVLRRVRHVIAGNEGARARMRRHGVPEARVSVLPQLGVDVARFANGDPARARTAGAPPGGGAPVVGFIGRVVAEKSVGTLVDAVEKLDARLLVVGDGAELSVLRRRTAGWPDGKATFAGAVRDADVPDYFACMDVLVLPSRTTPSWAEQFGHVLIEAMAAGVPVVGSSSGAIPEVIGEAGLVFSEGDTESLRRRLEDMLGDRALRAHLSACGRARVERCYTNARVASEQMAIYRRLVKAPAP